MFKNPVLTTGSDGDKGRGGLELTVHSSDPENSCSEMWLPLQLERCSILCRMVMACNRIRLPHLRLQCVPASVSLSITPCR